MTRSAPLCGPLPRARRLLRRLGRFARDRRGSATFEFVLIAPAFLLLFLASFESGMLLVRQVMLDRVLDQTVRELRIGTFDPIRGDAQRLHQELKRMMCARATNFPNCASELKLEMLPVDPRDWDPTFARINHAAQCVDRVDSSSQVASNLEPGVDNELVILRACENFDPFFPTWGLGRGLSNAGGYYQLISSSAYVVEPKS